jgi:uncharacterized protein YyaL (SSP411 family)
MPNQLIHETSPYLLQHAQNPVEWYAWSEEALAKARAEDKPILLSIGYSACHWCHVMEHESFENPGIAQLMNDNFINIKVDREERPDLDQVYMGAVQIMTGSGGWPLTVFLLPTGEPFYGGTYFPPEDRYGRPGFPRLLTNIAEAHRNRRKEVHENAAMLRDHLNQRVTSKSASATLGPEILDQAARNIDSRFDPREGGFGTAPKFPPSMTIDFLLRHHYRTGNANSLHMATLTLDKMACGGVYDQIGGGFHRYSTDDRWLVPHFEKMLYDNALLARAYLDGWRLTENPFYRKIVEEVLDFIVREMRDSSGGFYSTQDADSEGVEGKFYVWDSTEFERITGSDAELSSRYWNVTERGNWEGHNILNVPRAWELFCKLENISQPDLLRRIASAKARLYDAREKRVRPGRDEKILTDWNGLALRAFAEAAAYLGRDDYRRVAESNADFILTKLWDGNRLLHSYKDGRARFNAYLDDYANLADGLFSLYQLTFETRWLSEAERLCEIIIERFSDNDEGGFFFTAADHETLVTRTRDLFDNATPSGNSVAADLLVRMGTMLERNDFRRSAEKVFFSVEHLLAQYASGLGRMLAGVDFYIGPSCVVAVAGAGGDLVSTFRRHYLPRAIIASGDAPVAVLRDRPAIGGKPTAYVCENLACKQPVQSADALEQLLPIKSA